MSVVEPALTPRQSWLPLHPSQWDEDAAAHLLRRIGFSARPADIQRARQQGLQATVEEAFTSREFSVPTPMWDARMKVAHLRKLMSGSSEERRRELRKEMRENAREANQHFALAWLEFARDPKNSAQEKYVLFLENVFVVGAEKVGDAGVRYDHQNLLRRSAFGSYRTLVKEVSRSPAMIQYLDLHRSSKQAPNENFARELMELFTLGEGNYTERDIKEAARALTGYGYTNRSDYYFAEFRFNRHRYDPGYKEIFGQGGRWNGDEVIEMIFEQPGAITFLPRELGRFYLTETPISDQHLRALGEEWAKRDFDQHWLLTTFFSSRLFYEPAFRGELIKSPIHYYLGLCQDLNLDVYPVPQIVLNQLRAMGQAFQNPPNVRGWLGGKHWITASTLSARQQLVRNLLYPTNEKRLNADAKMLLDEARADGKGPFAVDQTRMKPLLERDTTEAIDHVCRYFLPRMPSADYRAQLVAHIESTPKHRAQRTREAILVLLQSPQYQLS